LGTGSDSASRSSRAATSIRRCVVALVLLLAASTARAVDLEGTWYLLVHYRDAGSSNPDALRWEDRVWHFQRDDERLLWTDYELVSFVDSRGRFERDRRVVGAWEPSRSQRREIERGLFPNPRGARVLALEQQADGVWRTRSDPDSLRRSRALMSFGLAGSVAGARDLPIFTIDEMLRAPGSVASLSNTVMTTKSASPDGDRLTGDYARSGDRRGTFRMIPTSLRRRLNPHAAFTSSGIVMKPDSLAEWANLLPALARPWHYLPQRSIRIETIPPGALLDLAYLRHGVRLMFEQVRAPLEVELPSRFVAHRSDVLSVQAFVPGYQPARITAPLHGDTEELEIDLERLANSVEIIGYRYLAQRGALTLLTRAELEMRVGSTTDEFYLLLSETALGEAAGRLLDSLQSPQIESATATQLGRDLMLRLLLVEAARDELPELRIFTGFETARQLHRTVLVLSPPEARTTRRGLDGLAEIGPDAVSGCARHFDAALRQGLEATDLARALTPSADFVGPILRAALRRLAELSADGRLRLADGTRLRAEVPLEFEAALGQAHEVEGLLALLRALVARMASPEDRAPVLRGLVAPELDQLSFGERVANAERSEQECGAGLAEGPAPR
jgi:hypothetical protein